MGKRYRRVVAAVVAAAGLGIGSAVWATSGAAAASTAAPSGAAAAAPACTAGDLAVWVNIAGLGAAAGTIYYPLEFTNTTSHACSTEGYPGVSATNANLKQLGEAANRDTLYKPVLVTIPAGGTVHALFAYHDVEVTTSGCKPTTASLLRVYPPNATGFQATFFDLPVCTLKNHFSMSVSVVQPGTRLH